MLKIGLCDDDVRLLKECKNHIKKIMHEINQSVQIIEFHSAEEFLLEVSENMNSFDIFYMDILMKKMTGLDAIRKIRKLGYKGIVIFWTSSKEYAIDAYDVSPLGYILKDDMNSGKFDNVFKKAISLIETSDNGYIFMNKNKGVVSIALNDILYIESYLRKVRFILKNENMEFYGRLSDIKQEIFEKGFIQCHRSFIVNIRAIKVFDNRIIILKNNQQIPIGEKYYKAVKDIFFNQFTKL